MVASGREHAYLPSMNKGKSWLWVGVACTAMLVGFGCGDDDTDGGGDSGTPDAGDAGRASDPVLRLATFNTGLLATVGFVPEREPLVNDALAELEADLLCVQEVWEAEHWDELVAANEDERPHTLRLEAMPGVAGDCSPEEFGPVRACAELMCPDAGPSDLVSCTTTMCADVVATISTPCGVCLLDAGSSGDLDVVEAACLGAGSGGASEPLPPEERSYALGGSFGIGLLSAFELTETDTLVLDASTTRRGILYAKVEHPELGDLDIFCTHLSAVLNDVRYEGRYDTWAGENSAHVEALIEWVDDKTADDAQVIVLGDLNTGPAQSADDIEAEVPASYAQFPEAGFDNAFLDGDNAKCTFCSANPLVLSGDTGVGAAIDHILTRGIAADVRSERILDGVVSTADDDDGGTPDELPLSDHYGLAATFYD
jgi:endonuclease/exonuclease/phosphatase family metal-dependent hydrolase